MHLTVCEGADGWPTTSSIQRGRQHAATCGRQLLSWMCSLLWQIKIQICTKPVSCCTEGAFICMMHTIHTTHHIMPHRPGLCCWCCCCHLHSCSCLKQVRWIIARSVAMLQSVCVCLCNCNCLPTFASRESHPRVATKLHPQSRISKSESLHRCVVALHHHPAAHVLFSTLVKVVWPSPWTAFVTSEMGFSVADNCKLQFN